ncbi:MAG: hypothetical protein OEQ53_18990, partial [Saprospiraceae bacterium]|nr:hypothetical protein [Saprospiraceae bacterium]
MRKLSLYLLIVFFTLPLSYAQLPPASFYHLKRDEDVLSSSYVCLEQDEFGFIWFGSFHGGGLYRYDGYELKSFVIDPADLNNSLVSNRINSVYAPGDNNLYISTHGGWNKLDLTTGDFQAFAYDHQTNPEEGSFYTNKIIKDSSQRLWIASYYGLSMMESWQ